MSIHRSALRSVRMVYLICAERPFRYREGSSRILYIGKTKVGVLRLASSLSHKARKALRERGQRTLEVHTLTCPARQGVSGWSKLERDLLISFKILFGTVPRYNKSGKNFRRKHMSGFFNRGRLERVLESYG